MSRLERAHVHSLTWTEDEDTVYADGYEQYEIDENNEIAVFSGEKCVEVKQAHDFDHAVDMVIAMENVARYKNKRFR